VVSWYVMMGIGEVVTLRVPAERYIRDGMDHWIQLQTAYDVARETLAGKEGDMSIRRARSATSEGERSLLYDATAALEDKSWRLDAAFQENERLRAALKQIADCSVWGEGPKAIARAALARKEGE
jgi:hypothetical protein